MTKRQTYRGFDDGPPGGGISDLCDLMWNHRRPERQCAQCGKVEPKRLWLHPGRMFKIRKGASHDVDLCSFECSAEWYAPTRADGAVGFVWVARAHRAALEAHAAEHGYTDAEAAVFLARGGHGPSELCGLVDWDADLWDDGSGEHVTPGPNRLRNTAQIPCADRAHFGLPCGIGPDVDSRSCTCTCPSEWREVMGELIDWFGEPAWTGPDLPAGLGARIAALLDEPDAEKKP